ncbi:aldose 1-epimerase family protein [Flavobacterium capsici]|uniref:Aldose 1-epimerase family protein n=1 Tax=Flavobacterium capsici TaxID=3075618 RepID=A0AA96EV02_9FLAO|nr:MULTISPECIES: aldose 1-epimerase family protein [unclassified Flavobacterium]WNM18292.1 aldose 1-epimerase family protein [Flavobacterium sp. PMR2A8]WNM22343.1 aldose 1-epimerase family protein [Flavobacterium sp. PMTSA4]
MIVAIENKNLTAKINLKGAELFSLQSNTSKEEYIWEGSPVFWGKHSPILFPIVGTLKDNCYLYNGKQYEMHRHGFARDLEFKIKKQSTENVTLSLSSNELSKSKYPFDFELLIDYKLNEKNLIVSYTVINTDSVTLPYSIGGHPAFALNDNFENYSLEFEINETLKRYILKNDLISSDFEEIALVDKKLRLNYALFQNDAMIIKQMNSKSISILKREVPFLKFDFKDFPNFGIWTKIGAPFICLEPWVGYSDTFENSGILFEKEGIQTLESKSEKKYSFSITIL